jgi:hypothetical protein
MAYPGDHADGSEGIGSFLGWSKTQRGLTKAVGTDQAATVREILRNTKSGPGKEINDFKQMLKTIKENLNTKMEETGELNKGVVLMALENLMLQAMPIIQEANNKILAIIPRKLSVKTDADGEENDKLNSDFGNSGPDLNGGANSSVTADLGYEQTPKAQNKAQEAGQGLFMVRVPNAPWGAPLQMQSTNSCAPNAHAMFTPMPVHNYCVVHANAHGFGGAQEPFSNAACGPWQSALCGAHEGNCAQPGVCYVMAQ